MFICISNFENLIVTRGTSLVVANQLDCNIVLIKFEFQWCYYIHFETNTLGKGVNPSHPSNGLKSISTVLFYKNGFGIKYLTKVNMS